MEICGSRNHHCMALFQQKVDRPHPDITHQGTWRNVGHQMTN